MTMAVKGKQDGEMTDTCKAAGPSLSMFSGMAWRRLSCRSSFRSMCTFLFPATARAYLSETCCCLQRWILAACVHASCWHDGVLRWAILVRAHTGALLQPCMRAHAWQGGLLPVRRRTKWKACACSHSGGHTSSGCFSTMVSTTLHPQITDRLSVLGSYC